MDYGRNLTLEEVRDCTELSADSVCQACGVEWIYHHIRCEGSENAMPIKPKE